MPNGRDYVYVRLYECAQESTRHDRFARSSVPRVHRATRGVRSPIKTETISTLHEAAAHEWHGACRLFQDIGNAPVSALRQGLVAVDEILFGR